MYKRIARRLFLDLHRFLTEFIRPNKSIIFTRDESLLSFLVILEITLSRININSLPLKILDKIFLYSYFYLA